MKKFNYEVASISRKLEFENVDKQIKFKKLDVQVMDFITKEKFFELENAINERVHLKKFHIMEKNNENLIHKDEFAEYQKKMREIVSDLSMKLRPLARSRDVETKVQDFKMQVENSL